MGSIRRGSVIVPTAAPQYPHPWKVEWAKGSKFKCFLGIINDSSNLAGNEWKPSRFPEGIAMQMTVNQNGMSQRSFSKGMTAMKSEPFDSGARTGSLKIYSKATFGRCTSADAVAVNETDGFASWSESAIL